MCHECAGTPQYSHPFIYESNTMKDLTLPPGAQCATAKHINDHGEVVGQSMLGVTAIYLDQCISNSTGAFVWSNNSMADLQTLLQPGSDIVLNDAFNINDNGEILGTGFNSSGQHRVVLLVPCD